MQCILYSGRLSIKRKFSSMDKIDISPDLLSNLQVQTLARFYLVYLE